MKKDENVIRFGIQIAAMRRALNISQEELAYRCGFHRTYIGMIERGERAITISNLFKLAQGLNTSVTKLFEYE